MSAAARFWALVDQSAGPDACWQWLGSISHGYGQFSFGGRSVRQNVRAHRYALSTVTPLPEGAHVLHSCDNPLCVNPKHLRIGTHEDNMRDMAARERSRTTKLTADDVRAIRRMAAEGIIPQRQIAHEFGVSQGNVGFIVAGKTWKHVAALPGTRVDR